MAFFELTQADQALTTSYAKLYFPAYPSEFTLTNKAASSIFVRTPGSSEEVEILPGEGYAWEQTGKKRQPFAYENDNGNVRVCIEIRGGAGGEAYKLTGT